MCELEGQINIFGDDPETTKEVVKKDKVKKAAEEENNRCTINYLKYDRKRGNFDKSSVELSSNNVDTIIETLQDYSRILQIQIENIDNPRKKLQYKLKAEECRTIAEKLIEKTGYCKYCENARKKAKDDIGADAMTLLASGYKR